MIIYRLTSFGDGASKLSNLYASTSLNTRTRRVWNACIFRDLLETTHPKESTITPSLPIRWGIPLRAPLTTKKGFQNRVVFCRRHKCRCPPQSFGRAWRPWKKRAKNLEPNRKSFRIRTSMVVVFLLGRFFPLKSQPWRWTVFDRFLVGGQSYRILSFGGPGCPGNIMNPKS